MEQERMRLSMVRISEELNHWLDLNKIIHGDRSMSVLAIELEKSL